MTPADRLAALRAELARAGVDGFLVPRADEHLGEYVPPSGERLAWLTGFTGSAGLAVVLMDRAAVFTDGRYTTQAAQQTEPALWERRHITEEPAPDWLTQHAPGRRIGYDPWLHAEAGLERLEKAGVTLVPLAANPLDAAWADRPAPPMAAAAVQALDHAGIYWPTLRAVALGLIDQGLIPVFFGEGKWDSRLEVMAADLPKGRTVWLLDRTDMAHAKATLGRVAALEGNVPLSLLQTGTPDEVREYCRKLIEIAAPGGGFLLDSGAAMHQGNAANVHAMISAAKQYGTY